MNEKNKLLGGGALAGVLGTLIVLSVTGLGVAYTGAYNVAATEEHSAFGHWVASTTMYHSIAARADDETPPSFTSEMVAAGAGEYKAMCQQCHGGPGVDRAGWAATMLPQPPELVDSAQHWSAGEIRWIVEHGIKSTGMPAFGPGHDEETLWSITAFVTRLPEMSPADYAAFPESEHHGAGSDHHADENDHHSDESGDHEH